jgi:epimerase transport system membrane fusion protein|tara:strand:+ start:405 stop:1406 length:1002 start_codon:yes stop_codon:yes gene_type:complete
MSQIQEELQEVEIDTTDKSFRGIGHAVLLLTFGLLGTWSYFAPLESAAIAPGTITVKYNNKTVQHFEGGMVKRLLVQEGMKVEYGDVLIELDDTQIKAETEQLNSQYLGLSVQKEGNLEQERSLAEEIDEIKELLAEGFADKQSLRELQRQYTRVQGQTADMESRISAVKEQMSVIEDKLERTLVRAPVQGTVLGLMMHTKGGVISAGMPLLDIVPDGQELTISAKVATRDIDRVSVGLDAEIRLSAFNQSTTPKLFGRVINLSPDKLINQQSGSPYYEAQLELLPESIEKLVGIELLPGMPAEVIISTGERTLLQYLSKPVTDAFARSFLED